MTTTKFNNRIEQRPLWVLILSLLLLIAGLATANADPGPYTGQIGLGDGHTCLLQSDGSVDCYGRSRNTGQYPGGSQSDDHPGPFKYIASGFFHNCGIYADDTAVCWGEDISGAVSSNPGGTWKQIAVGDEFTCGLRFTGMVECWGKNNVGQTNPDAGPFDSIELGGNHACGFHADGSMGCWGSNNFGQANDRAPGTYLDRSVGTSQICVLQADGSATCWGYDAANHPGPFIDVEAGYRSACALDASRNVTCWGYRVNTGSLPASVTGPFAEISSSLNHGCGILETDGSLKCWGNNTYGQADAKEDPFGTSPDSCDENNTAMNVIYGTPGNDKIKGTPGDDIIIGYGGNDRIEGLGGNDCLIGGPGNDQLYGDEGDDILWGGEVDNATVYATGDRDKLYGDDGNDELHGGGDKDRLD
ncbi:MAG: hypothetical protein KDE56_18635, partial [Anaerolineales bacterium]|nr:hypothetical protein [Anaerolineales bacterium]